MKQWRVLLLDTKRSNPNHYICLGIERALRDHHAVESVVKADYLTAIEDARRADCNLFIAFDGEELNRSIVARLQQVCGTSVAWVTEDPYEQGTNKRNLDLFDIIFTNDRGSVAAYGDKGRHLPFAADPGIHFHAIPEAVEGEHYLYDLFFAGTAWPNRVQFLKELQSEISGINLKLALPHNPYLPEFDLDLAPSSYQWRTPNSEFTRFANRSRSVLTLHRVFSSSEDQAIALTPGPRLFEVALAGGTQFIDMSIPEIEVGEYFEEGTEFIGFRTVEECIEKLRYYLANPGERLRVARAAQERARSQHLYSHRVDALLKEVAFLQPSMAASDDGRVPATSSRPKVLFVTHNIIGVEPYGGVEVYQEALRTEMGRDFEFLFYTLDRAHSSQRRYVLYDENLKYIEDHECALAITDAHLVCDERERLLASLLLRHSVDFVHFQHLIGHTPSLLYVPSVLGIPSMLSLHDYYGMCSRFNLIDYKGKYCDIPNLPKSVCDVCLNAGDSLAVGSQARRRAFFARALEQVDVLHANTEGVAETYRSFYPRAVEGDRVRVYGVPMPRAVVMPRVLRTRGPLKVAILGNFTRNKGADEIIHAFNQLRHDDIEFTIFGQIGTPYGEILGALSLPNVRIHGAYAAGSLVQMLREFSLSLHYSIWPETYCITLSEAWQAGLVPVVADTGALGERVTDGVNGFKLPPTQAGAMVDLLRRLAHSPEEIERVRSGISEELYIDVKSHALWLSGVYSGLIKSKPSPVTDKPRTHGGRGLALSELGVLVNHATWKTPNHTGPTLAATQTAPPTVVRPPSMPRRIVAYARQHGMKATTRRILQELSGKQGKGGQ